MCDGWLTPKNILPFPYSPHTVRSTVYFQRRRACHRVRFWRLLLHLGSQVFVLNPGTFSQAFPCSQRRLLISEDRGSTTARWSVVEVGRGEPVKCLSQIFNCVSQWDRDRGSACGGHHSRPAPSEHYIKVVKQICLLHKNHADLENILLCEFCLTQS